MAKTTPANALRGLLMFAAVLVVVWAFYDVGRRFLSARTEASRHPITLTVLHWGSPAEDRIVDTLVTQYEASHPLVRIVRINAGTGSGGLTSKLKTMMSADQPPDVFYLPPDILPELAELQLIAPLDDRFNADPPDFHDPFYPSAQAWRDDFYPLLLNAFRYDRETHLVGKGPLYALPKDFTTLVFYCNLDLFKAANIDVARIQREGWTWDEFHDDMRAITRLSDGPAYAGRTLYGTLFQLFPGTLRSILWSFDADFFANNAQGVPDFRRSALDSPNSQRALDFITEMRLRDHTAFNASGIAKDGGQEFLNGNIGCTGPVGRWLVPVYKGIRNFKWDVLPVPHAAGVKPASQIFYVGWTMSSHSAHPSESYDLLRFLCGRPGQVMQAREGLAVPCLQSVANSPEFLAPPAPISGDPPIPPHHSQAFLDAVPAAKIAQSPRQAEWDSILMLDGNRAIVNGQVGPAQAAKDIQKDWLAELDSPLRNRAGSPMPWGAIGVALLVVGAALGTVLWRRARSEQLGSLDRAHERAGFLFIAPWLLGFILLTLGPMLASLLLSIARWNGLTSPAAAEWVGSGNFSQLFFHDPTFWQSLKVTAYYVAVGVPVSQVAALAVALLMNLRLRGVTIFRTIYFVPSVVSGAALAVLWLQLYNNDYGLINAALRPIAHALGTRPPNWFGVDSTAFPATNDAARWAVPALVIMGLWGVGSGMIIYLAGLKGIPQSLYEAAVVDGAGPLRRLWNVTLPMLSPLIFYNLVMGIIGSFQIFTQAYMMTGPGPDNATLFYVLNLYQQAFEFHNMGYASAMAWVLFVIVLALTLAVFKGSKRLVYYEGLKA